MSLFMLKLAQYLILNNHIFSIPFHLGDHLVRIADVTVKFQYRESENRKICLIRSIRRLIFFDSFLVILDRYKKSSSDFAACIKICAENCDNFENSHISHFSHIIFCIDHFDHIDRFIP